MGHGAGLGSRACYSLLAAVAGVAGLSPAMAASTFEATEITLGSLVGTDVQVTGMNNAGQVCGTYYANGTAWRAFTWSQNAQGLGAAEQLPLPGGATQMEAWAINDDGNVAVRMQQSIWKPAVAFYQGTPGTYAYSSFDCSTPWRVQQKYVPPAGTDRDGDRRVYAINNSNQVVGDRWTSNNPAYLFNASLAGGTANDYPGVWDGVHMDIRSTMPFDINSSGASVGSAIMAANSLEKGIVSTSPTSYKLVDNPYVTDPNASGNNMEFKAVNDRGDAVGWAIASSGKAKAILYRDVVNSTGQWVDLGLGQGIRSAASDINSKGQIVGNWSDYSKYTAALFRPGKTAVDLNTLTGLPQGYRLTDASRINDKGQILATATDTSNVKHYFLLAPVPTTKSGLSNGQFADGRLTGWTVSTGSASASATVLQADLTDGSMGYAACLTTGSPVAISQLVNTPAQSYQISFDYMLTEGAPTLDVSIDGVSVGSVSPGDWGQWQTARFVVSNQALMGLNAVDLALTLDDTQAGSQVLVSNVGLVSAVPEPTSIGMTLGSAGLLLSRRRRP